MGLLLMPLFVLGFVPTMLLEILFSPKRVGLGSIGDFSFNAVLVGALMAAGAVTAFVKGYTLAGWLILLHPLWGIILFFVGLFVSAVVVDAIKKAKGGL